MKPKFTVILTTYNRKQLLLNALNSLLKQTEKDWEAWIIDDGSTDGTEKLLQKTVSKDPRLHYFHQENQGEAAAKNKGIQLSTGEFVTFLDSDDAYEKQHLQLRKEFLQNHPNTDFLHGGIQIIGNPYVVNREKKEELIHLSECVIGGTFFVQNKVLKQLNGFRNLPLGCDADLMQRAKQANFIIAKIHAPTYIYNRNHPDSITHNYLKKIKTRN